MNRLVIFDLDGVLIDSRELHYKALNDALRKIDPKYVINRDEHLSKYDGLNTTRKLEMLAEDKGLERAYFDQVWQTKQKATFDLLRMLPKNKDAQKVFEKLKYYGWKVAVASNSIRETVQIALNQIGVLPFVDYYVSNEDVKRPKPFPEMYWKCMTMLNVLPRNTIIVEDSHIGRQGAMDSGGVLFPVEDSNWFKTCMIDFWKKITELETKPKTNYIPWRDSKLNVLIPMAGAGSRFFQAGYKLPKPLIDVNGKPMIQVVVENLNIEANYIFIVQKEHDEKFGVASTLEKIVPNCTVLYVNGLTEGAACTTLLARSIINNSHPLVIANSDQFIEWNSNECMYAFKADGVDGGILTFYANDPKWSYAKVGDDGFVSEVAEKNPISNQATVGVYYWKKGSDYVKYAEQMIAKNIRTNNEFYVCPVFNEAIADGKKIRVKDVQRMWGIGTPEDLTYFLENYK
jgi:HAD superfamily hydrolase (TIGR01509 family)